MRIFVRKKEKWFSPRGTLAYVARSTSCGRKQQVLGRKAPSGKTTSLIPLFCRSVALLLCCSVMLFPSSLSWIEIPFDSEVLSLGGGRSIRENPAKLPFSRNIKFKFSSGKWIEFLEGSRFEISSKFIGIDYRSFKIDDTEYDENGVKIGDFKNKFDLISIRSGFKVGESLSLGFEYKNAKEKLYKDYSGKANLFSFGMCYFPSKNVRYGFLVSNFGGKVKYESEKFPSPFKIGSGFEFKQGRLLLAGDIEFYEKEKLWIRWGMQFTPYRFLSLRTGFIYQEFFDVLFGFGLKWRNLILNFAIFPHPELGTTQIFDIELSF